MTEPVWRGSAICSVWRLSWPFDNGWEGQCASVQLVACDCGHDFFRPPLLGKEGGGRVVLGFQFVWLGQNIHLCTQHFYANWVFLMALLDWMPFTKSRWMVVSLKVVQNSSHKMGEYFVSYHPLVGIESMWVSGDGESVARSCAIVSLNVLLVGLQAVAGHIMNFFWWKIGITSPVSNLWHSSWHSWKFLCCSCSHLHAYLPGDVLVMTTVNVLGLALFDQNWPFCQ